MIRVVLLFPPKDYCRIRVNLESRYGTCSFFYEVSALITLPKLLKLLLILFASYSCWPWHPVLETFSEPARSTKYSLLCLVESFFRFFWAKWMINREWLRELRSFMPVNATLRLLAPESICLSICSPDPTLTSVQFWMNTPRCRSSLISKRDLDATS